MSVSASHSRADALDPAVRRRQAASLGMWLFLATEVLLFGGLFGTYAVYRHLFPEAFALASGHLDELLGGINTAVLLVSSYTMALGVAAAEEDRRSLSRWLMLATVLLGALFLGIKGYEYHHKAVEHLVPGPGFSFEPAGTEGVEMFFLLYFVMTGLHALHVIIGMSAVAVAAVRFRRRKCDALTVEITGLYWHLVDIVWVFLFPLLYLV